jgi:hypothetical protein
LQIHAECWNLYFDGLVMKTGAGGACSSSRALEST